MGGQLTTDFDSRLRSCWQPAVCRCAISDGVECVGWYNCSAADEDGDLRSIPLDYLCDGENDCGDPAAEDEINCSSSGHRRRRRHLGLVFSRPYLMSNGRAIGMVVVRRLYVRL